MVRSQELHCHNCNRYVQFEVDLELNGNYVLDCPNCGHKHYRTVRDGRITDQRWGRDPSQGGAQYIQLYATGTSWASTATTSANTVTYSSYTYDSSTSSSGNYAGVDGWRF